MSYHQKILITGENGFIGSHLCRKLDSLNIPFHGAKVELTNLNSIEDALIRYSPNLIIHLAGMGIPSHCDQQPAQAYQVNLAGTALLIEAMVRQKSKAKILFTSTAQVYAPIKSEAGKNLNHSISENSAISPPNLYGRTKLGAEQLLKSALDSYGIETIVFRIFNHVHKTQPQGTFLSSIFHFIQANLDQKIIKVPVGNMELYRDIGAIEDLLDAFVSVLKTPFSSSGFEVFNVCNGTPRKLCDIAKLLVQKLEKDSQVDFYTDPTRIRADEPLYLLGSYDKLHHRTGWKPRIQTDEQLIHSFLQPIIYNTDCKKT